MPSNLKARAPAELALPGRWERPLEGGGEAPNEARSLGVLHLSVTGYTPCGRHNRMATISAMLENKATLGTRKPV